MKITQCALTSLLPLQKLDTKPLIQIQAKAFPFFSITADIERVTSSLLDSLPISDKDKNEMSGVVEGAAMNAVNGAVWVSMLAGLGFVVLFNFFRG